jgi:uncharacterized protein YndB with AHSA1/START domain
MNQTTGNRHGSAVITFPSDTEYLVTRVFDAPAELVFRAYTTPELVRRWWGYESDPMTVCEIDLRVGGQWRFVADHEGMEVAFHGEYREIDPPHGLVSTEIYEGDPTGTPALNILTLEEADGVTTMTLLSQLPSKEVRDMIIATGMEHGMQVSYNRLEDIVTAG